jgi:hypothetical protein
MTTCAAPCWNATGRAPAGSSARYSASPSSPSASELLKLAKAYNIPPSAFFMSPDKPSSSTEVDIGNIEILAAEAGIHPCAFLLIRGDLSRIEEAKEFTRMVKTFELLPLAQRERWLKIDEEYPLEEQGW